MSPRKRKTDGGRRRARAARIENQAQIFVGLVSVDRVNLQ